MIHIITHILPQEIDQLEQLLTHLKKSSVHINYNDYIVEVVLNTKLTDWSNSKLDEQFFIDKFNYLEKLTNSWCETKFEVSDGSILGCNDIRRRALRTSKADYIMYLDADNVFSETLLFTMREYCKLLNQNDSYDIIIPQTTRMWDTTWDIITNEDHFDEEASHNNYFNRDPYLIFKSKESTSLELINGFKFAGWGTTIPTKLREIIDIPDSLGSYGVDDTFIMTACSILKQKGYNINQWVINGEVIIENNKFRYNPYQDYLVTINKKDEFLNQAHLNFNLELQKYFGS
jgi:hypothetical protein